MKHKPNKYGMKLFVLCDLATGYRLNATFYTGSAGGVYNSIQSLFEQLCADYFGKGHCIYLDYFYTSPALLSFLWSKKTLEVDTVKKNRKGLPQEFNKKS